MIGKEKLNNVLERARLMRKHLRPIMIDIGEIEAINDAFMALEQRAEAAEHERDCHMDIAEHFKARCKELEQQKTYGYVHNLVDPPGGGVAASIFKEESRHYGRPVFTRPAPAINLTDLVPQQVSIRQAIAALENHEWCNTPASGYKAGVKDTISTILRNIEEAK